MNTGPVDVLSERLHVCDALKNCTTGECQNAVIDIRGSRSSSVKVRQLFAQVTGGVRPFATLQERAIGYEENTLS